jgi:hypothetical protein
VVEVNHQLLGFLLVLPVVLVVVEVDGQEALLDLVEQEIHRQLHHHKEILVDLLMQMVLYMDPEEEEIAAVGLTVGMVNGVMVMSLERWGLEVTIKILQTILSRYQGYMHKLDGLN